MNRTTLRCIFFLLGQSSIIGHAATLEVTSPTSETHPLTFAGMGIGLPYLICEGAPSVSVTFTTNNGIQQGVCDGTIIGTPSGNSYGTAVALPVTFVNEGDLKTMSLTYGQRNRGNQSKTTGTYTIPPAVVCSITIPDAIDLGNFTAEQIKNGVTTDEKLRLAGQCATNFTLTIAGNGSSDGNYLLGNDVKMALGYNYGANQIVNGQPFSPANSQNVDIKLSSATGGTPVPGEKRTALTVTLALP